LLFQVNQLIVESSVVVKHNDTTSNAVVVKDEDLTTTFPESINGNRNKSEGTCMIWNTSASISSTAGSNEYVQKAEDVCEQTENIGTHKRFGIPL